MSFSLWKCLLNLKVMISSFSNEDKIISAYWMTHGKELDTMLFKTFSVLVEIPLYSESVTHTVLKLVN